MQESGMIAAYAELLAGKLDFNPSLSRRVRQEVQDHLWEAARLALQAMDVKRSNAPLPISEILTLSPRSLRPRGSPDRRGRLASPSFWSSAASLWP